MKLVVLYYYLSTKLHNHYMFRFMSPYIQIWRIKRLLPRIAKKSKFYQDIKFFDELPVINKTIMSENFDDIITVPLTRERALEQGLAAEKDKSILPSLNGIAIGLSTGTSGNRGVFLAPRFESAMWAGIILAKLLPKSIFKKQSISLFLRSNSEVYEGLNSKTLSFTYYSLANSWDDSLKRINSENPNIIVAPPSVLLKLARAQSSGEISLSPLKIFSAAEVLTNEDKVEIENCFKQILHQIYQCTEGFLAATCKFGNLHLNEDFIIFEKKWLDSEKTRFSPILTDTLRECQPNLRYELNDILIIDKDPCPCGSTHTRIEKIEGRCDDIFKFGKIEIYPDYIRRSIISCSDSIREYQVKQVSSTTVELSILSEDTNDIHLAQRAIEILFYQEYKIPKISLSVIEYCPPQKEDKLRRIISLIK
jgi:putative adenylate-forming enzyme